MKKNISLLGVFFLLLLANNVLAQRVPTKGTKVIPSTTRKAADKKKETQQSTQQGAQQGIDLNNKNPNTAQPTIDLKNVNQTVNLPDKSALEILIIRHFNGLKTGSPSQKQGASELLIVDRFFPVLNTTNITVKDRTQGPIYVTATENLVINANVQDFAHFSEKPDSWLKAGQIITAQSFLAGNPVAVTTPRNPITLNINLPGVANNSQQVLYPEQASRLLAAEEYLITQNGRLSTPKLSFSFHKIHSIEEMELKLTGKYRGVLEAFSKKIGLREGGEALSHYYMLEIRQNMFSIRAAEMSPHNIYKQPVNDMTGQVYIDKVDYGRSGIIIFKSPRTLEQLGITASAGYSSGISEENMKTTYKQLIAKEGVNVFARFYGGSSAQDLLFIESTAKNGNDDIFSFIRSRPNNHQQALPIGYTLKNMKNELIGQKTNKTQTVKSTTLSPPVPFYKLKVTLTDIQSVSARDADKEDDFGIQQYIVYKTLGKEKVYNSRNIKKFYFFIDRGGQVPNILNPVVMGGEHSQIPVKENFDISKRDRSMINNSLVFHITPEELNDPNASFEIFTWLKEYSSKATITGTKNEDKIFLRNEPIKVKIKDIVEILYGINQSKERHRIFGFPFVKDILFHYFGPNFLPVANIQKKTPLVLEGYIQATPLILTDVAIWVQFELLQ